MLKFIKNFLFSKKFLNVKRFGLWLNSSIKNRAIFVYSIATFSIIIRYCLYSLHNGSWLVDSVTIISATLSYSFATFFLFVFGVLRSVTFGEYIKRFIDIDRIRENRIRAEKFRKLVVEAHKAHEPFRIYSYNCGLTFSISFMLLAMTAGTSLAATMCFLVLMYNAWIIFNILYFARCMHITPVPEDLKTIKPTWLLRLEDFNKNLALMNGVGNVAGESVTGSSLGKRAISNVSKAATKSFNYLADAKNIPTIIKTSIGVGTFIFGFDYTAAEAGQRTSYATKVMELYLDETYSPDPDTRSKTAALRRRGINLLDCCEPNSRCLNPELVENKYEVVRPYESKRYLTLEEKANALEEENRKLRLNLEDPGLK
jgi:hypothetical protein